MGFFSTVPSHVLATSRTGRCVKCVMQATVLHNPARVALDLLGLFGHLRTRRRRPLYRAQPSCPTEDGYHGWQSGSRTSQQCIALKRSPIRFAVESAIPVRYSTGPVERIVLLFLS